MKIFSIILVFFVSLTCCSSHAVKVEEGELTGTTYTLYNGRVVHAFLGIPYAAPPTGPNRFKKPKPVPFWSGIWNATHLRSKCLQIGHASSEVGTLSGEEDCLYLNVFTPQLPNKLDALMNVMVYIHGGAFMFGNGLQSNPEYIMQKDNLVFVSMNYRVGVLGFFSANNRLAPGNNGLKDQVAALKWVKRNIQYFGGDPNKVTLFGNSAGGASVHYHYFSPLSEGLFHNGISSSGSVLTPWARPRNVTEKSIQLASLVGCPTEATSLMMQCLRKKPAERIVEATKNFLMWRYCPFTVFGPVIEPRNRNAFLSENPIKMLQNKRVRNLPWMAGVVQTEGLYPGADIISKDAYLTELNDRWYEIAPNLLQYNFSVPEYMKDSASSMIKHFYFGDEKFSRRNIDTLIQMLGDRLYYNDITYSLKLHAAAVQTDNVYCYNFIYRGTLSLYTYYSVNNFHNYGTAHGDDQFFILSGDRRFTGKSGTDLEMVELMTSSFMAFMNSGNPNTKTTKWSPLVKGDSITCLGIHSPKVHKMEEIVGDYKRNEFWRKLAWPEYPEIQY